MRLPVFERRRAGVLLHLTSLEAPLGRGGRAVVDWLADAGFTVWQFLPLGPTGADGSPYWVRSDFAGNPLLLDAAELPDPNSNDYAAFVEASRDWLEDYAAFEALSAAHGGAPWWAWPPEHRDRQPAALEHARVELADAFERVRREQFAFAVQWVKLREYAHSRGVRLFGDLPFYVAPDSAETWADRGQFQLDEQGQPKAVAGVPPDYFSQTGQLWGNPLYDWAAMQRDGFKFWRARLRRQLERVDALRIDHFRALVAHWAVPAGSPDARSGTWRPTPGPAVLQAMLDECGDLPVAAEDLGVITAEVTSLRKQFSMPGMRVLQFAFSGNPENVHLPYLYERDLVVYTGTHDNDTTLGWFRSLDPPMQRRVAFFLNVPLDAVLEGMMRTVLNSAGGLAILPAQDLLGLGSEARFNMPGTVQGNWRWRLPPGALSLELAGRFAHLNRVYGRV